MQLQAARKAVHGNGIIELWLYLCFSDILAVCSAKNLQVSIFAVCYCIQFDDVFVGYYPPSRTETYDEDSLGGSGSFLTELCTHCEKAAMLPSEISAVRHVIVRVGWYCVCVCGKVHGSDGVDSSCSLKRKAKF